MTPAQNRLYWREWGALTRTCKAKSWPEPDRHALHKKALGRDKSHNAFTNADLDKVLAAFRTYSAADDLRPQLRAERMPRTRLEWKITIEQTALLAVLLHHDPTIQPSSDSTSLERQLAAERYIIQLMRDRFGTDDIRAVSDVPMPRGRDQIEMSDLELLRDTLAARINTLRNKAGLTIHELNKLATIACPSTCRRCHPLKRAVMMPNHTLATATADAPVAAIDRPF